MDKYFNIFVNLCPIVVAFCVLIVGYFVNKYQKYAFYNVFVLILSGILTIYTITTIVLIAKGYGNIIFSIAILVFIIMACSAMIISTFKNLDRIYKLKVESFFICV